MRLRLRAAVLLVACGTLASCQFLSPPGGSKSPLRPLSPAPETVALEVFSARLAPGDRRLSEALWADVDEQQLPAETRRSLAQHGLRCGVIGPHPPPALVELLKITEHAADPATQGQRDPEQLLSEPTVTLRAIYTRAGWRNEIIASKTYDALPLLERDGDEVRGQTYHKAEGRFAMRAYPQSDGRVRLEISPELQFGDAQQRWTGSGGALRAEAARPKKTFDGLDLKIPLAPGEMLLVTCLPDRPGSVGHWFFMEDVGDRYSQKLLVVRLAQTTPDGSFAAPGLAERLESLIAEP